MSTKKCNVNQIMEESLPPHSKENYLKAWTEFMNFTETNGEQPTEADYLQYFDYLHRPPKNFKASSLWSIYSKLNSVSQMKYRIKLQNYPQIKIVSNSYFLLV